VKSFLAKQKERKDQFYTSGGFPVKRTYTVLDIQDTPVEDVGLPGRFPFTRGPYPTMYRSRHWTMRQIAGFGPARTPTSASNISSPRARPASPSTSTCPP